jgi:hypothetical protein
MFLDSAHVAASDSTGNAIVSELDVALRAVYLKPPPWIVKSTAGKPARSTTRDKLLHEHLELGGEAPLRGIFDSF